MNGHTLIVIHGVGDSPPGASLLEVAKGLRLAGLREDLVIGDVTYPRLRLHHPAPGEVVEVNWSDVARPKRHFADAVAFWIRIVIALLDVGGAWNTGNATVRSSGKPDFVRAYGGCFAALLVYCIYPPLLTAICTTALSGHAWAIAVAGLLMGAAVAVLARCLGRYGAAFRAGYFWAAGMLVLAVAHAFGALSQEDAIYLATFCYVAGQFVAGLLLAFALIAVTCHRGATLDQRIARAGLLYLPFFIVSALGALAWVLVLAGLKTLPLADALELWQARYAAALDALKYNLVWIELTFAGLVAAVGSMAFAVAVVYVLRAKCCTRRRAKRAGALARDGIRSVIAAGAVGFCILVIAYAFAMLGEWPGSWNISALQVYSFSALRIVPYLGFFAGPLALVAGLVVDVLFYVTRVRGLATAERLRERLRAAIEHARRRSAPIVVAAHSQGSVIAIDTLGRSAASQAGEPITLLTAGSPIASLYERFLDSTPKSRAEADETEFEAPARWLNAARPADYIGAPLRRDGVSDIPLRAGGHTRYWRSKALWSKAAPALWGLDPAAASSQPDASSAAALTPARDCRGPSG